MKIRQIIALVLLVFLGVTLMTVVPRATAVRESGYRWFDPIVDIRGHLLNDFVETPDDDAMQRAVIDAMIESLDDPFTTWVSPEDQANFSKQLSGNYVGIGARIHSNREWLTIITPMEQSPALKAGIRSGDVILSIEGESTQNQPVSECIDSLLGLAGTTVEVHVRHTDDSEEDLVITRAPIEARTAFGIIRRDQRWQYLIDDVHGIAYVRLEQFTDRTDDKLRDILKTIDAQGSLNGVIIDVRDNRGGALSAALETADLFVDDGTLLSIRSARPGSDGSGRVFNAHAAGTLLDIPVIVLVNDSSASASEIVAGSLKDNDRALVVGERSFGKGSVQEVRELDENNGLLKFTTAYYYLPSGRSLHKKPGDVESDWGVDPSVGCLVPEQISDAIARVEAREPWTIITDEEPTDADTANPQWIRETFKDPALAQAVELVSHHVESGSWPELVEQDAPGELALRRDLERALKVRDALEGDLTEILSRINELNGLVDLTQHGIELPEDTDLEQASLIIHDREGKPLGEWLITSPADLRRSLLSVELKPLEQ